MKQTVLKFLIKLSNASKSSNLSFIINNSTKIRQLLFLLYDEGYIQSFKISSCKRTILIFLRQNKAFCIKIWNLKKKYISFLDVCKISSKNKLFIFSTNVGYKSLLSCKKSKLGGKLCMSV